MGESTDEIKQEIAVQRNELGSNLNALEDKAKSMTDWKGYFEKNPMTMIGVAFGGGLLLATMAGGRRSSRSRSYSENGDASRSSTPNKTMETWQNVKGALFGVASTKAIQFLDEVVPGFGEHFGKQQTGSGSLTGSRVA